MRLILHPTAKIELFDLARAFISIDPALADKFDEQTDYYFELILSNPALFHERRLGIRRANFRPNFKAYFIAYFWERERIVILAVGHGKRRPYYFRDRLEEARNM
jgi:plasmid stabilization system protein ParE